MKKIIFVILLMSFNSYGFDFDSYLDRAKSIVNDLATQVAESTSSKTEGDAEVETSKGKKIKMPKLPEVVKDAKNLDVYNKDGKIYKQGSVYNNLEPAHKIRYQTAFVQELYLVINGTEGDKDQILSSLNTLERGGSREGVYRSIVLSNNYSELENFTIAPSEKLIEFSVYFGKKYLGKNYGKTLLAKLNLYSIKRVIVENTLELIEAFPVDGEDLYSWYSILSSDLSQKFPKLWSGKTRTNPSVNYHYKWAQTVPFQHIKSELIIKIHKVMNSLQ